MKISFEKIMELLNNPMTAEANTVAGSGALLRPVDDKKKKEKCKGKGEADGCCGSCLTEGREDSCRETRTKMHVQPLMEAQINPVKRELRCVVITDGPGNQVDKNYYSIEAVEGLARMLDGDKSYINHQTDREREERGEGDIWHLCGYWKDSDIETVEAEGVQRTACVSTLCFDNSEAGREAFAKGVAAVEHARLFPGKREPYCGLSINKKGMQTGTVEADGSKFVGRGPAYANITAFAPGGSSDVVTRPARSGKFRDLVESVKSGALFSKTEGREMDWKKLRESLKKMFTKTVEQDGDDDKTVAAKAKLVDKAVGDAVAGLGGPKVEQDAPPMAPEKKTEQDPELKPDVTQEMDVSPELLQMLADGPMPMHEGESEADFAARVGDVMNKAGGMAAEQDAPPKDEKKSEESVKTLESFRKENPEKFKQLMEGARVKFKKERSDFSGLKDKLVQETEGRKLAEAQLMVISDLTEGRNLLEACDVSIPSDMLCEADMVGKSTEEKERLIERFKSVVESGGRLGGQPKGPSGGSTSTSGLNSTGLRIKLKETKKD